MRGLFSCMAGACAALAFGASAEVGWRRVGPGGGGWIQSLLASRHDGDTLDVGYDVGGFFSARIKDGFQ